MRCFPGKGLENGSSLVLAECRSHSCLENAWTLKPRSKMSLKDV